MCCFDAVVADGEISVAAIDEAGTSFLDDLQAGDVWFL